MGLDDIRFQQILNDAKNRNQSSAGDSLIVPAHLAQMRLFMVRQGVEFFSRQDTYSLRRDFLRRVCDFNEIESRLDSIVDNFLVDGKGLFYMRPSKDLYRVHYFTKDQYRAYYDEDGELEEVQLVYSFQVRDKMASFNGLADMSLPTGQSNAYRGFGGSTRWILMKVRHGIIEQTISNEKPQFEDGAYAAPRANRQVYENTLGFIPAVEVFNNRGLNAGEGRGEFDWLASYIMQHDRMTRSIKKNLNFFGSPTLVSSRPRHDLIESESTGLASESRSSVAANSGFITLNQKRSGVGDTFMSDGEGIRVPRVISNVESGDRVNYITADPVPGDLTSYTAMYQEMIRAALGGVDDLSISSGATAYEVRTLYGRVQATAKKKCRDLYENGLCRLLSMMIFNEERIFRESLAEAMGVKKPMPFIPEENPEIAADPRARQKAEDDYRMAKEKYGAKVQELIANAIETRDIPSGVKGLIPDGDVRVEYRFKGEVFELSTQELLQNSIVTRNLQELGVSSIEALQYLFPEKTPEERAAMLSGYPFRTVEAAQRAVGVYMDVMRGLYQVPHPESPELPLAADPALNLVPFINKTLGFLQSELSYSATNNNVDPAAIPSTLTDADRARAQRGLPTELESGRRQRRDELARRFGPSGTAQSLGSGVPGNGGGTPTGSDAALIAPALGGTLAFDPANPYSSASLELGRTGQSAGPTGGMGAPDLMAGTNSGLPTDGTFGPAAGVPGTGGLPGVAGRGARRSAAGRSRAR